MHNMSRDDMLKDVTYALKVTLKVGVTFSAGGELVFTGGQNYLI